MNRWILTIFASFFFLGLMIPMALAVESTFSIGVSIAAVPDITPPTTVVNIAAEPLSVSQIEVSWDASTDDTAVGGYRVDRDGLPIATTTSLMYTDTGLLPNTFYSYTITAFDLSGNYATSSVPVATSTDAVVSASTSSTIVQGSHAPDLSVSEFNVSRSKTDATITFNTSLPASVLIRWGRTADYEKGYMASEVYRKDHRTVIQDLEPNTQYRIEVVATSRTGANVVVHETFVTQATTDTIQPSNVSWFRVNAINGVGSLSWQNPTIADFDYVRIVASPLGFPTDPFDGRIVYEGPGTHSIDPVDLDNRVRFYTAFVFDTTGNVSSGAIAFLSTEGNDVLPTPDAITDGSWTRTALPRSLLRLVQDGVLVPISAQGLTIVREKETSFTIPYAELPEHLKTIIVTLVHPDDQDMTFSFLMRANQDMSAYEAAIGFLPRTGTYRIMVDVYDYATHTVSSSESEITVVENAHEDTAVSVRGENVLSWWWVVLLFLCSFGVFMWRRQ